MGWELHCCPWCWLREGGRAGLDVGTDGAHPSTLFGEKKMVALKEKEVFQENEVEADDAEED